MVSSGADVRKGSPGWRSWSQARRHSVSLPARRSDMPEIGDRSGAVPVHEGVADTFVLWSVGRALRQGGTTLLWLQPSTLLEHKGVENDQDSGRLHG